MNVTKFEVAAGGGSLASGLNAGSKPSNELVDANVAFVLEKTKSSANSLLMDASGKCVLDTLKDKPDKEYQVRYRFVRR